MIDLDLEKLADRKFDEKNIFEAERLYMQLLSQDPKNKNALYKLAYICVGKMDYDNAELFLNTIIHLGGDAKSLLLLAHVCEEKNNLYDAIVMYERLIEINPDSWLYEKVGDLYIQLELYDQAIGISQEYVEKYPTSIAYRRLFLLYLNLSKEKELINLKNEIEEKFKNDGLAFNLLGMYKEFIEFNLEEAEELYKKSLKLGNSVAGYDLALCLKKMKRYDEAEKYCKKILDTYPKKNHVINLLANIYLCQRKMRKGFKYYLDRTVPEMTKSLKNPWNGKPSPKDVLLVYCDCVDKEVIRNLRYVDIVNKKFKKVILACSQNIEYLLKENKYNVVRYENLKDINYDKYTLISELQYYLNMTFELIPKIKLTADIKNLDGDYKVGLVWKVPGDSYRALNEHSINLTQGFDELLNIDGVKYYSLQKNDVWNVLEKYPQVVDLSINLNNLYETASYINSLDLVISVDTDVLHLAGCLGIPTCAIIPENASWYWFDDDSKTNWYNSVDIIRLKNKNDVKTVSEKLIEKIKDGKHKKVK